MCPAGRVTITTRSVECSACADGVYFYDKSRLHLFNLLIEEPSQLKLHTLKLIDVVILGAQLNSRPLLFNHATMQPGKFSDATRTSCDICPGGTYVNRTLSECIICPMGQVNAFAQ